MPTGYKFPLRDSAGNPTSTIVDMEDIFVPKDSFLQSGLWTWGNGAAYGQLGLNSYTSYSSPVQVGSLTNWKQVTGGSTYTAAVKNDGTLWSWGINQWGQCGHSNTTNKLSPVQVGTLNDWRQISLGFGHAVAVKTDGTVWNWGRNEYGQLGGGTNGFNVDYKSSPVQVGSLTNWKQVSGGFQSTLAIKTDGTLWGWGWHGLGQLGLGNTGSLQNSPVQVGTLTNWKQVSTGFYNSAAVKIDGTLWMWGYNNYGQLGLNSQTGTDSPVQVGTGTNWKQVACGQYNTVAIQTNGTLWAWGYNTNGELGLGDTTHRSSPVQVGSLNNWKQVSCSWYHATTIKTDGTLWSWGLNSSGQLGLGDRTSRSSPVQIGSLNTWKLVGNGVDHAMGIMSSDLP